MIQLVNVTKVYSNGVKALDNVSVKIEKGEFVFLIGESGAGKTTLIRLLFREELPTNGQIIIGSRSVLRLRKSDIPILRRNVGVIFQDFKLLKDRTVYENVAFAMEVTEKPLREIKKRVPEVLKLVGLEKKADITPENLSGGEAQRVAIARAIVNNPLILIADEPTGNLDPKTSWEIMELLVEINKRGTTIIMASHARNIVDKLSKRVLELAKGKLVRDEQAGSYHSVEKDKKLHDIKEGRQRSENK